MAEVAIVGYVVDGVERAEVADGTDGTDVAEVALRMNALLYFDCLVKKYCIQWALGALCCNSDGIDGRVIPLREGFQ